MKKDNNCELSDEVKLHDETSPHALDNSISESENVSESQTARCSGVREQQLDDNSFGSSKTNDRHNHSSTEDPSCHLVSVNSFDDARSLAATTIADAKNAIRALNKNFIPSGEPTMTTLVADRDDKSIVDETKRPLDESHTQLLLPTWDDAASSRDVVATPNSYAPNNMEVSIVQAKAAIAAERHSSTTTTTATRVEHSSTLLDPVVSTKQRTFPLCTNSGDRSARRPESTSDHVSNRILNEVADSAPANVALVPTLMTAHLVRPDDCRNEEERRRVMQEARDTFVSEAVAAEEINVPLEDNKRHRNLVIMAGGFCFLIIAIVISAITSVRLTSSHSDSSSRSSPIAPTLVSSAEIPTATPALFGDNGYRVFVTRTQLISAVDAYNEVLQQDMSPEFSDVAMEFGYPIGTWDVSRITDFSRIFDPDRTELLDSSRKPRISSFFDEDLSGWDVSNAISFFGMFAASTGFTGRGLETWIVSKVTDFSFMFANAYKFNGDLSKWNTSSATLMESMFLEARLFNADVSLFNVSKVRSMVSMFGFARSFQGGDLRLWDVANVENMDSMFRHASVFSGKISTWNTGKVSSMKSMFTFSDFDDNVSSLSLENVHHISGMFYGANKFRGGNLNGWNTSRVIDMSTMFVKADSFNGNLSEWDVSRVVSFSEMFSDCKVFDGDLSKWNTSSAEDMFHMFYFAHKFTGNLSQWDTRKVTIMNSMFHSANSFNSDISTWNMRNVDDASSMFLNASAFRQDLCQWREQFSLRIVVEDMFAGSGCEVTQDPTVLNLTHSPLCALCPRTV